MKAENMLMPKLRFPQFRDAGAWVEKTLSNVATVVMGSSPKSEFYNENHDGLPLLQGNADIKNRLSAPRIFTSEITKECHVNDILMSVRAPVGSVAKAIHHACIGRGIASIHSKKPNSQEFLYQWLLSYESRWANISQGGTFDAINSDDLKGVVLTTPLPDEQQKVADCLSSLDELIAAQARKVDALKTHKKGLMQQLFPREGETQPRLRFPEFRGAAKWKTNTLGNLVEIRSGSSPSAYELREDGKYPFVKVEDLNNCEKNQTEAREYSNDTNGLVPRNSVIFPKRGAAIALNKLRLTNRDLLMDTNMMALTPDGTYHADFLFHYLSQIGLDKIADSSTIPQINNKHIIPFLVLVPVSEEQQEISDFLTSLDALITAATQQLDTLKTHKKGLMQQLFPSAEAVEA